jgi:hypothetical protein
MAASCLHAQVWLSVCVADRTVFPSFSSAYALYTVVPTQQLYNQLNGNRVLCPNMQISIQLPTPTPRPTPDRYTPTPIAPKVSYYIAPPVIVGPIVVGNYMQNGAVTFVLSSVNVFIQADTAQLAGTLYLDISQFDGTTITLIQATNITGQWEDIVVIYSSTDCISHTADVQYTQTQVVLTVLTTSLCSFARTLAGSLLVLSA